MPSVDLKLRDDGEGAWPDLAEKELLHCSEEIQIAGLRHGTASGKPSVAFRFDLPDGRVLVAETTLQLFLTVADALKAKYGDPRGWD